MNLDDLALFLMIVEKQSLSAAAREMNMSPATVSEKLAALERRYGVTLLVRTTRSLSLTEEGKTLRDGARRLLEEANTLASGIRFGSQRLSGLIRISAPVDLGTQRIVPILDSFLNENPAVSVDLHLGDGLVDLVTQGLDFAVRFGALKDSGLIVRHIGENHRVICASPRYLARYGTPKHPQDLTRHDCIVMRLGARLNQEWSFRIDGKIEQIKVTGARVANDGALVRRWCVAGYGICSKSWWDVQEDIREGRLIELLTDYATAQSALQLVYTQGFQQPQRVRLLMDRIVDILRASGAR